MDLLEDNDQLIWEAYKMDNVKIIDLPNDSDKCCIFFSDNGLYWPNYREIFKEKIIYNYFFEWENISQNKKIQRKFSRIIYVRDVWKVWYIKGISVTINTVDKLIEELQGLVKGYELVTVGNSAGGYIATLVGMKLNASMIHNFSGQFRLYKEFDPLVEEMIKGNYPYIDLKNIIMENANINVFYYLPLGSDDDVKQYNEVKVLENIKVFFFESKRHGHTMFSENIPIVLSKEREQMRILHGKCLNKTLGRWEFLFRSTNSLFDIILVIYKRSKKTLMYIIERVVFNNITYLLKICFRDKNCKKC